jgi:hypothetical protein
MSKRLLMVMVMVMLPAYLPAPGRSSPVVKRQDNAAGLVNSAYCIFASVITSIV